MSLLRSTVAPGIDGTVHVVLEGELDSYSSEEFRNWLADQAGSGCLRVEVDLDGVTFIDSAGLAALLAGTKWLRGRDGDLVLRRPRPAASRVFEITGLHKVFTIQP